MLDSLDAGHAAQLYDEGRLLGDPLVSPFFHPQRRSAPKHELVGILEDHFDERWEVEFAYHLMAEAYRAGRGARE